MRSPALNCSVGRFISRRRLCRSVSDMRYCHLLLLWPVLLLSLLGGCHSEGGAGSAASAHASTESASRRPPAQITVENGQTFISLDAATQNRLGLASATLEATTTRAQAALPGVVLTVQELATARTGYVAAEAQLQKARLQAGLASKEYARLKTLSGDIAERRLQEAEATMQSADADVAAAEQQLHLHTSATRQEWGPVAAGWVAQNSPQLQRLLNGDDTLIQMTVPADAAFAAPKSVTLELSGSTRRSAKLVSPFPRLDPRIQGPSYLYLASGVRLPPGLMLLARLPVGGTLQGVVIPAAAVVWSEGKAWVYTQVSPERFTRSVVATDVPVGNGYFTAQGFAAGDKIVTVGAQALLSEEMLLHSQGGGDVD